MIDLTLHNVLDQSTKNSLCIWLDLLGLRGIRFPTIAIIGLRSANQDAAMHKHYVCYVCLFLKILLGIAKSLA